MKDINSYSEMEMYVTWGDCDAAGISYYARNFDWFTNGRLHFFREHGFPYMTKLHENNIFLVCISANCQYKKMLYPDEKITVRTYLKSFSRAKMTFLYEVIKQTGEIAAEGSTVHAFADQSGHAFDMKKRFPELWSEMNSKLSLNVP